MKNSFRKLIPIAAALGFAFAASSAQAFTLENGSGGVYATNATSLDWNSTGSGVAKGIPSAQQLTQGRQFDFLYQANLSGVNGDTTGNFRANLDSNANGAAQDASAFEFTIVAKLSEFVKTSSTSGTTLNASFGLNNTPGANKVAIYYDTKANAFTSTGTGFDDGVLVALLTVDPNVTLSTFTTDSATCVGIGSTKLTASILEAGDFVDSNYLAGLTSVTFKYDSNLNLPAGDSLTSGFHKGGSALFPDYSVTPSDLVFKVDGAFSIENGRVPEPGSIMLLGMGMLGLVGAKRRKAPKA